uniref:DUF5678 domain-containing protein n=1 Tax=Archaeoglobus fulgidus TaxID=2234 RepID=A0A7J2TJ35_ARCFL
MEIELILRYDGKWVAEGKGMRFEGETLGDLDRNIENELKKHFKGKIRVFMRFDYSTFPHWIIQFHPYYFNRTLIFEF